MDTQNNNIRNLFVNKSKNSDFLEALRDNLLIEAAIKRIIASGNYYIYTLDIADFEELAKKIEEIQDKWM